MRLTLLFVFLASCAVAQVRMSSNTILDLQTIAKAYKLEKENLDEINERYAIHHINGQDYVAFLGKKSISFNQSVLESQGIIVSSQIGEIISVRVPVASLNLLSEVQGIESLEIAGKIKPMLNTVPFATRADSVWAGYGLPQGYTGKDVIVGITDWGFDYSHPNFYDTLLQDTRILAAWDQFKTSGPHPNGYAYGTVYENPTDLINAGADTANIYSYATHGSHVAGIAGGSGAGTPYRGIGFESQFLFVTFLVDESAVLDAWQWMYDKAQAEGKRLVVNMSWGLYHFDAIDGTSALSQAIENYSDLGVVFVTSAGNNGDVNFHLDHDFSADTMITRVNFYNGTQPTLWGQSLHMWGESGSTFEAGLRVFDASNNLLADGPLFATASNPVVDTFLVVNSDTLFYNLSADDVYPSNGRPQMRLRVKRPTGGFVVTLKCVAPSGKIHFWNVTELTSDVGNWGMPFTTFGSGTYAGDNQYGIGAPACTDAAISIAAYAPEYYSGVGILLGGQIATFSSFGPLMTDSLKPDITAPGRLIASSISSYTDASFSQLTSVNFNGRTYPFARFSGTSMSSPATAGVVTLMLEANPYLAAEQVKEIIIETARIDTHTGNIPPHSRRWGWGKVNAYAAVQLALNTVGTIEIKEEPSWTLFPNPATNTLTFEGITAYEKITVVNAQGQTLSVSPNENTLDISSLSNGVYLLRIQTDGRITQKRFVVNK